MYSCLYVFIQSNSYQQNLILSSWVQGRRVHFLTNNFYKSQGGKGEFLKIDGIISLKKAR